MKDDWMILTFVVVMVLVAWLWIGALKVGV